MAFFAIFTTARTTAPDPVALAAAVRAAVGGDATAVLANLAGPSWRGKKATAWSASHLSQTQTALDTTAADTPRLAAQRQVDSYPIELRALVLALVDQLNVLRAASSPPLNPITPAQALAAIRAKAGTL